MISKKTPLLLLLLASPFVTFGQTVDDQQPQHSMPLDSSEVYDQNQTAPAESTQQAIQILTRENALLQKRLNNLNQKMAQLSRSFEKSNTKLHEEIQTLEEQLALAGETSVPAIPDATNEEVVQSELPLTEDQKEAEALSIEDSAEQEESLSHIPAIPLEDTQEEIEPSSDNQINTSQVTLPRLNNTNIFEPQPFEKDVPVHAQAQAQTSESQISAIQESTSVNEASETSETMLQTFMSDPNFVMKLGIGLSVVGFLLLLMVIKPSKKSARKEETLAPSGEHEEKPSEKIDSLQTTELEPEHVEDFEVQDDASTLSVHTEAATHVEASKKSDAEIEQDTLEDISDDFDWLQDEDEHENEEDMEEASETTLDTPDIESPYSEETQSTHETALSDFDDLQGDDEHLEETAPELEDDLDDEDHLEDESYQVAEEELDDSEIETFEAEEVNQEYSNDEASEVTEAQQAVEEEASATLAEEGEEDEEEGESGSDGSEEQAPKQAAENIEIEELVDHEEVTSEAEGEALLKEPPTIPSYDFSEQVEDNAAIKLDLARAYVEMGDYDAAGEVLHGVLKDGSKTQQQEAKVLMGKINVERGE